MVRPATFELSDGQWAIINERLKLPNDARFDVSFAIHAYREQRRLWKRSPAQVAARLKRTAAAAKKLAKLLEGLEEQERIEVIEASRYVDHDIVESAIAEVRNIETICADASTQVSKIGKTWLFDRLVESLDRVLREFAGKGLSQEKSVLSFLTAVFAIADACERLGETTPRHGRSPGQRRATKRSKSGIGSVKEALRRFKPRVEFSEKDLSKPDAKIPR